ncbi:MAG: DUF4352 domain-containing protein [Oscillospiraceae bacterium]|nr:DUF4352 domain-containing protein [Oscillospiraceae bacterium]
MSKLSKCKTCGAEIAKSAKTCPRCGAKQKKHTVLGIFLLIIGLFLILAAIGGGSGNPQQTVESNPPDTRESTDPSQAPDPKNEVFTVGDSVSLKDITVTLVDVSENNGGNYMTPNDGKVFIVCEFDIENNSDKDIAVSSILSFEAYIDDYSANMNLSAMLSANKNQLDGSIAAGKKMNGVIGYEADPGWESIEIRFKPDFWSGSEFLFTYSK